MDAREAAALDGGGASSRATSSFAENSVAHPHVRRIEHAVHGGETGEPELLEAEYLHSLSPDDLAAVRDRPSPSAGGAATDELHHPPDLLLDGVRVPRDDEGPARILRAFRATIADGRPPLVGLGPAVEASLVRVAAADCRARGSVPVPVGVP